MNAAAPRVFISYRREDASGHAGRLYDAVAGRLGDANVFMDVEMEPGIDFVERITQVVGACRVLLVVIGPWTRTRKAFGTVRGKPSDTERPPSSHSTSCNGPSTTCIGYESPHSPSVWSGIGSTSWLTFERALARARADGSHPEMKAVPRGVTGEGPGTAWELGHQGREASSD
jgi:TIR domain